MKFCTGCQTDKPRSEFGKNRTKHDGLQGTCKKCQAEARRAWRAANPERDREVQARYYANNQEARRASLRAWRAANPEHVRRYQQEYAAKLRDELLDAYGRACSCCGEDEEAFLCLDHIDGVPEHHRDRHGRITGTQLYLRVRDEGYPDDYRLLCWNCNAARGIYGMCPHEVRRLEEAR